MALVDQVQTFLVTAYPEIVVLIFDDIVDEGDVYKRQQEPLMPSVRL